jgi:pilus assembly protein Flp/PilA
MMNKLKSTIGCFLKSEDGPTAVEYAVMLALIIVVCLASVSVVGSRANSRFNKVNSYLT